MNTRVKKVGAIAAASLVVTTLAACGGSGDDAAGGDATAPVEISFRWWGGDERQARQLEAIELFEEQNPDIRVNAQPTSMDGYFDTLGVEMAGRNAPDVFTLGGSWPLEYGGRGGLFDLTTMDGLDLSPFSDAVLTEATIDGQVFGVPTGGNTVGLVINKDIFEAAGVEIPDDDTWTWDDFVEIAEEISANTPDGTFGAEMRPQTILGSFAGQRGGGGLFNTDGEINVSTDTLAEFFDLFLELQQNGGSPGASLANEIVNVGPEETLMGRGLSGMFFAFSNQIGALADSSGANLALLRIPGETQFSDVGTAILPSQWFSVSAHTEHPEAAARLVDFLVNDPGAGKILGVDRGNPINEAVASAIADDLTPMEQEQVHFIARVSEYAVAPVAQPEGAGEQESITMRSMDEVLFERLTSADAAAQWLQQMQAALDAA